MSKRASPLWIAAALAALLEGGPAAAQVPGEHARICSGIGQRRAIMRQPPTPREISFLLFDAAERGCDGEVAAFLAEGASLTSPRSRGKHRPVYRGADGARRLR